MVGPLSRVARVTRAVLIAALPLLLAAAPASAKGGCDDARGTCQPKPAYASCPQKECIAEDGAHDAMAAHRAAMEDQFLDAAADCDFVGMQTAVNVDDDF